MTEFISVWAMGGEASLSLTTSKGLVTMGFNCTLGTPGAPHSLPPSPAPYPPPPSPPRRPRHRGPAEKEKNRQRAARHQAGLARKAAPADIHSATSIDSVITAASLPTAPVVVAITDPVNSSSSVSTSSSTESQESEASASCLPCEECGFEAASSVGLKIHTSKKHEEIPQLDGESPYESDTDCWWINQQIDSLKCFQKYIDVLKDIDDSTLSEQEKNEEQEKLNSGRKSAFGDNFKWFPPWDNS